MRNKVFSLIKTIKITRKDITNVERIILSKTKTFVKNNSQILFTHVDKGNVIVALDRTDCMQKMEALFVDPETYTNLKSCK